MDREPLDLSPLDVTSDEVRFERMVQNVARRARQARALTVFGHLRRHFVPAFAAAALMVVVGGGILITGRTVAPPAVAPAKQSSGQFTRWVRGTHKQRSVWDEVDSLRRQP